MPNNGPYSDKDRLEMNKTLRDLQEQQQDHEKAINAGVTEVQPLLDRCVDCQQRIKQWKSVYFPNKP